jgi:DNA topoisomerase-1
VSAKSAIPPPSLQPSPDSLASARAAGLRYVYDTQPGIHRVRSGKSFRYIGPDGKPVRDPETLARIKSIVIPPAWTRVWICTSPNGHLQATGRDARGRKQSRYHPRWRSTRDEAKYDHILAFAQALPLIRAQVDQHLALPGLPREKVLATIVRLLETTHIRIGNAEYARTNHSFGLTTLRRKHVAIHGATLAFHFNGKSGVAHNIALTDRRLARIIRQCRDTPGYELFTYLDADGHPHSIGSSDVNDYLDAITPPNSHITAKDFRTWAATNLAALALSELEHYDTKAKAKKNVLRAVEAVSKMLGNTPAICRKCYIHPAIFDGYLDGSLLEGLKQRADEALEDVKGGLTAEEVAVTAFLSRRLGEEIAEEPKRAA